MWNYGKRKSELKVRVLALDLGSKPSISITTHCLCSLCGNSPQILLSPHDLTGRFPLILLEQEIHSSPSYLNSSLGKWLRLSVLWGYRPLFDTWHGITKTDVGITNRIYLHYTKLFYQCKTVSIATSLWILLPSQEEKAYRKQKRKNFRITWYPWMSADRISFKIYRR